MFEGEFEDVWNSAMAREIRSSILEGTFKYCHHDRCALIINGDLPRREDVDDERLQTIIKNGRTYLDDPPKHIFMANDESCNLSCPSCRDRILVANRSKRKALESVARRFIYKALEVRQPIILSMAGQGDPWASPHYRSILRYLAENDCGAVDLRIYTNGVLMTEKLWSHYAGVKSFILRRS